LAANSAIECCRIRWRVFLETALLCISYVFYQSEHIASVFLTRKFRITKKCGRDRRCRGRRRRRIALLSLDVIHNKGEFQPTPNKLEQTLTPNHGT
jgi:hypothetical protein